MSDSNRRQFLKSLLATLAQTAGAVVVASATASTAKAKESQPEKADAPADDIQQRADQLAASGGLPPEAGEGSPVAFLNGAFRNTPFGSFRNAPLGGFRNTPLGVFRNAPVGGFRNTPLGPFGNGGWPNGGWGGFRNGGWPNGAWLNWW